LKECMGVTEMSESVAKMYEYACKESVSEMCIPSLV
jgi:hypothetical protein